jgi:type I restriction enzyme S subunit
LEETAQNIYKEWFVNFRFPNYENTPFNEETGLPMGWKIKRVIDFFEFTKGIEVGSVNYENQPNFENLPFLRVGDISKRDGGIYVQKSLVKDKIIEKNDILISFDGSIGSVGFGLEGSYSSGLRKINSKDKLYGKGFTYCLVKSESIQNTIKAHAKGTTILHAGTSILHLEFPSATDKIMLDFNQISNPIFEQLVKLTSQNQKLKEARDILLPRLMNRTIEV